MNNNFQNLMVTTGRVLLGLYFIVPALTKVLGFERHVAYMLDHGMAFVPFFLVVTIIVQLGGGIAMVVGYHTKFAAFVLAGLTLVISLVLHDFWTMTAGDMQTAHETQNFVKNMAIMAGLLVAAGLGGGAWSIDARRK